jgi:HlyD family secretion protein
MITRYLLPVIAIVTFTFAMKQMLLAQQKPAPATPPVSPAKSPFHHQLAGSGIIEPETENIAIGTHLSGVIEAVLVKVGDTVKPGQPLFRLDDRHLQAELSVRQAMLASSQASLEKLKNLPRTEELPPLRARVTEMYANLEDQQKQLARLRRLGGAASDDELTRREAGVAVATAQLEKTKADLALMEAGAWKADKLIAEAAVLQARSMMEQTNTELSRLSVKTPRIHPNDMTEFKVLQVNVRPGEFVGTQPGQGLVVLGYVGRLHVRVDIDENDISRFRPKLPGVSQPRGNPNKTYPLTFVRVEPYVVPKRSLTGQSTERVDTRVLQVIYRIDTRDENLYVGQQMEVFLDTEAKSDAKP